MTGGVDWAGVREACVDHARRVGLSRTEAEDVAQDTMIIVLAHEPTNAHGYALVVSERLAVKAKRARAAEAELGGHATHQRAEQEEHVIALQLAFVVRVRTRTALDALVDGDGARGRQARLRARRAIQAACVEAPPCRGEGGGGWEAGSPHAGRGGNRKKNAT